MAMFGKLAMPKNKGKEKEMSAGDSDTDLFGGESEDESSPEDTEEDKDELSALSDDDLIAECKKRGLHV